MLEELQAAIRPKLALAKTIRNWHVISQQLREPPRRRTKQIDHIYSQENHVC